MSRHDVFRPWPVAIGVGTILVPIALYPLVQPRLEGDGVWVVPIAGIVSIIIGLLQFYFRWQDKRRRIFVTTQGVNVMDRRRTRTPLNGDAREAIESAIRDAKVTLAMRGYSQAQQLVGIERLQDGDLHLDDHLEPMVGWVDVNGNGIPDEEDENVAVELAYFRDVSVAWRARDSTELLLRRTRHGFSHVLLTAYGVDVGEQHQIMRDSGLL